MDYSIKFNEREWTLALKQAKAQHLPDCKCTTCCPTRTEDELICMREAVMAEHKARAAKVAKLLGRGEG